MKKILEFVGIGKIYQVGKQNIEALREISFSVESGEIFGFIGHSGAGKSTLVRLINLLERPTSGDIEIRGKSITALKGVDLRKLRQNVGMIFQHFNLLASKTIFENIALPFKIAGDFTSAEIKQKVQELAKRVNLSDQLHKYPAQLSGGQKQRVGIARALATQPDILLCDEATSALDPQTTQSVLQLLLEINQDLGLTIILITHEMGVIRTICDKVAILDEGNIVEIGKVSDVFLHPKHPTTRRFVMESENVEPECLLAEFAHVPGRIVRVTFLGEHTYEPVLSQIARQCGIDFSILAGSIGRIKNTPYGQMIISLLGENINDALEKFQLEGLTIEELRV